ncbi:MAG: protein kinase [Candidatus Eisenbacteria bacterium]|nr:protein kinase [Candidatus Eisenbacteria bacterium]
MVGQTVSHYRILDRLGEGGMGVVYKAEDLKLGRIVALKFLPPALTRDEEAKTRFVQEARAASALDHPSICTIHEIDTTAAGELFICMALYEGETLRSRIRRGSLPVDEASRIARQVAEGLAKAHGGGVVHRDIKPENIFLTKDGQAKILDFGLAKLGAASNLTQVGTTVGTIAYMSPEQARGEEVDARTDIWSLGVVLYEMLAGRAPFRSDYEQAVIYSILNEDPQALEEARPDVPIEVALIAVRCIQKEPGLRFSSAEELAAALRSPDTADRTAARPAAEARGGGRGVRVPLLLAAAVLLAVAAGLVAVRLPSMRSAAPKRPMLVVLPLENRGPAEDEYFADGITDAITARLAGIHGLGVLSRQSAMQYKRSDKTVRAIGEELGADYVLEGTIQRERPADPKSPLRVTPSLIRVSDDTSIWADHYDVEMTEVFRVQSEIAEHVARKLDIALLEPERRNVQSKPTESLEAYEYYLRGGDAYRRRLTEEDSRNAIALFEKAVAIDSGFAVAWAALARARIWIKWNYGHEAELAGAEQAAGEAERLAPDLPETHMALGELHYYGRRDFARALVHFQTVQRGRPNEVEAISAIGWIRRRQGDWDGAVADLRMALELSPRDPTLNHTLGQSLVRIGRHADAEIALDRAIALEPEIVYPYIDKALLYLEWDGSTERAGRVLEDVIAHIPASEFLGPTPLFLIRVIPGPFERVCGSLRLDTPGVDTASDSAYCLLYKAEMCALRNETVTSRSRADSARTIIERSLRRQPGSSYLRGLLALAYAGLGEREAALREGKTAIDLLPVDRDAVSGPYRVEEYAQVCMKVGAYDQAIDEIERLVSIPSRITPVVLRLDPLWGPLRERPRFASIVNRPPAS